MSTQSILAWVLTATTRLLSSQSKNRTDGGVTRFCSRLDHSRN